MTIEEAILATRAEAEKRGYSCQEPVQAWIKRPWIFFGRRKIVVMTNAERRGGNTWASFDEQTGMLESFGVAPR